MATSDHPRASPLLRTFACALCLAACTSNTTPPPPPPTLLVLPAPSAVPPAPTATPTATAESAPIAPPVDLGVKVIVRPFEPGHYAVDVRKGIRATHARNWYTEETRASFVLYLGPDGGANGCRGHRSQSSNDGPTVHEFTRLHDQQGYKGRWKREGGWVEIDLALDNGACPEQRAYVNLGPKAWQLRCLSIEPKAHPVLSNPALACQLKNKIALEYEETYGIFVPGVLQDEWLLFGRGNGLRISWENNSVPPGARAPDITVEASPTAVRAGTWAEP